MTRNDLRKYTIYLIVEKFLYSLTIHWSLMPPSEVSSPDCNTYTYIHAAIAGTDTIFYKLEQL